MYPCLFKRPRDVLQSGTQAFTTPHLMSSPGNAVDLQRLTSAVSRLSGKKCNAPRRTHFEDQDSPNLASSADKYSLLAAIASERTERPRVPELVFVETSGNPSRYTLSGASLSALVPPARTIRVLGIKCQIRALQKDKWLVELWLSLRVNRQALITAMSSFFQAPTDVCKRQEKHHPPNADLLCVNPTNRS
jgi:hypothetical protein